MLVLSRMVGERIVIGEGPGRVVIEVTEVRGDRVRLGITAPKEVTVYRAELGGFRREPPCGNESSSPPSS